MNIFVLDEDLVVSAKMLCNKHVVKMIVESTQILSNCHKQEDVVYKHTHYNHPCCIWTRTSLTNYNWLKLHALTLCNEYTKRYNKIHKCEDILKSLPIPNLSSIELTSFAQAMPDKYKSDNPIESYKQYYLYEKLHFCKWIKEKDIPHFIKNYLLINNIKIENYVKRC